MDSESEAAAPFVDEAERLAMQRRVPEAVAVLERAISERPDNVVLVRELGKYLRHAMRPEESAHQLRRALELRPDDREARFQLGRTLAFDAHAHESMEIHLRLLEDYPHDPQVRADLATDEIAIGAPERALDDLLLIVDKHVDAVEIRMTLAAALAQMGRYREALVHLELLVAQMPGYFLAWAALARAHHRLARLPDWRDAVERACSINSSAPAAQCLRGDVLLHDGALAQAQACYEAALATHPRHFRAHLALGNLHANRGQTESASQHFAAALDIAPWDGDVQGSWAQFQETSLGQRLDLDALGQAARSLPHSRLSLSLGRIWAYVRGDQARAREWYAFTVEHLPEEVEALAELSRLDLELGDGASALRTSTQLVEVSPNHGGGWYSLGHAASRCGDAELALSALARAAELLPDVSAVRLGHGLVLLSLNRVEEAIAELQRAVDLGHGDGNAQAALAEALSRAGSAQGNR